MTKIADDRLEEGPFSLSHGYVANRRRNQLELALAPHGEEQLLLECTPPEVNGTGGDHDFEAALRRVTEETLVAGPSASREGGMIVVLVELDDVPVPFGTERQAAVDLLGHAHRLAIPLEVGTHVDGGSD